MDLRAQTGPNSVIAGVPNTQLSPINRSFRQKINKETTAQLYTLAQMDIIDIYRVFHPTTMHYTFFSAAHGTFSKIGHILGHKVSLNKFKKI
jgi:exonuclease III